MQEKATVDQGIGSTRLKRIRKSKKAVKDHIQEANQRKGRRKSTDLDQDHSTSIRDMKTFKNAMKEKTVVPK